MESKYHTLLFRVLLGLKEDEENKQYAIKTIDKDKIIEENLSDNIKKEIQLMRLVNHPYIVKLHEVMYTQSKIIFVLEYIECGDLYDIICMIAPLITFNKR